MVTKDITEKTIDDFTDNTKSAGLEEISATPADTKAEILTSETAEPHLNADQELYQRLYQIVRYWYSHLVSGGNCPFAPEERYQKRMELGKESERELVLVH